MALGAIAVSLLNFLPIILPSNSFPITLLENINVLLFELWYFLSQLHSLSQNLTRKAFFSVLFICKLISMELHVRSQHFRGLHFFAEKL